MSILCNCPAGPSINNIPISECPESFGQVQKVVFQRVFKTGATKNAFDVPASDPKLLASWSTLLTATDGTKVVQSPYIQAPATEAGAARTYGGGNETIGGIEINIGREPTSFTGNILRTNQSTIKAMKSLECENVGIYLVDEFGRIGALVDDRETPTQYFPIPIYGLFVGDKSLGGLEAPDMNTIQWKFMPNWSDNLVILTPTDFNALNDLATPAP
ncbi:MAG: hypothetical protein ACRCZB_03065 [Bacteroidales bacterium]